MRCSTPIASFSMIALFLNGLELMSHCVNPCTFPKEMGISVSLLLATESRPSLKGKTNIILISSFINIDVIQLKTEDHQDIHCKKGREGVSLTLTIFQNYGEVLLTCCWKDLARAVWYTCICYWEGTCRKSVDEEIRTCSREEATLVNRKAASYVILQLLMSSMSSFSMLPRNLGISSNSFPHKMSSSGLRQLKANEAK